MMEDTSFHFDVGRVHCCWIAPFQGFGGYPDLFFRWASPIFRWASPIFRWASPIADVWRPFRALVGIWVFFFDGLHPFFDGFHPFFDGLHPSLVYGALSGLWWEFGSFFSMGLHSFFDGLHPFFDGLHPFFDGLHPSLVYGALSGLCWEFDFLGLAIFEVDR